MIDHHHPGVFALNRALRAGKPLRNCIEVVRDTLTADALRQLPQVQELMAEAWEEGAQAAWGESGEGWNGEYTGRSGPSSAFRVHNPTLPNPYKETPNE